jgi:hypothetical protein
MDNYKIFELTGQSPLGTHKYNIRALSAAQAMGIADASLASERSVWVKEWDVAEIRTACFTHPGCDGADDTHEALKNL